MHDFLEILRIYAKDRKEPAAVPFVCPPSLIEPSFIKRLDDIPVYRELWNKANQVLSTSESVHIIGYSLPDADIMARDLIIKALANTNRRKITIVNPNRNVAEKFKKLFSERIEHIPKKFEDWIQELYG